SSRVSLLLLFSFYYSLAPLALHSFPTRRSSDLAVFFLPHLRIPEVMDTAAFRNICFVQHRIHLILLVIHSVTHGKALGLHITVRSEEHTSELQSRFDLVCRLLLEKKKKKLIKAE